MKRVIHILLSVAAVLAFFSCDNGEGLEIDAAKTLKVVDSDLLFSPDGVGAGVIKYDAVNSVSVQADKDWCTATVNESEKKVQVSVTKNLSIESRYARVTLRSGDESLTLTVQQMGEVLAGLDLTDITAPFEGTELTYPIKTNMDVKVSADKDWIETSVSQDKELGTVLRIKIGQNPNPAVRTGLLSFEAGSHNGSINVLQYPPVKRETRWTLGVEEGSFVYPHQLNNVTATADAAIAGEKYVLTVVPKSSITGSIEDYIFDVFAVEAKNKIDKDVADGVISSFEEGLLSGDSGIVSEDLPAAVYVLLVGFDATGYVTGLYQWAEATVADKMPTYYRWAGTWKITGREVPYSGATWVQPETWTITIDEDNLEKTLTVHGINNITTSVVVKYDAAVFKFTYNEEDGSITLLSQHGPTFPYSASYGDSNMMPQGYYTKNGGTSYTRVSSVGYKIFSATMSEDHATASVTPGIRNSGGVDYEYVAFRVFLLAGTGSTYTLSASSGVIPLPFEMTRIE